MSTLHTTDVWVQRIQTFTLPQNLSRPRLLYGADDLRRIRQRVKDYPAFLDQIRKAGEEAASYPVSQLATTTEAYYDLSYLEATSAAYLYLGEAHFAKATEAIIDRFLDADPWVAHVHWPMRYDHCAGNTSSTIVQALDAIAETLPAERQEEFCRRLVDKALLLFNEVYRERDAFWTLRDTKSNWRIMTCGETGLALLGTAEYNPHLIESLTYASEGVLDTLSYVPPEGDWPEGLGYWLGTLGFGLRFIHALYRMSEGAINFFEHPALKATGDYIIQILKPDGTVYNFNDNFPTVQVNPFGNLFGYLSILAHYQNRPDWAWVTGRSTVPSLFSLLFEDPDNPPAPPTTKAAFFPTTGIATMRSGWQPDTFTFVGFKSGPSNVGHSHLDANSIFVTIDGQDLIRDNGYWPQDHYNGFFEKEDRRWNYDANSTLGHNTLLVDGKGQSWGPDYPGGIEHFVDAGDYTWAIGEAAPAYAGLLTRFRRWLLFLPADVVVVFDEIESDQPRYFEWLIHYSGEISGERSEHVIRSGSATATLRWLYPSSKLWRVSDVKRTTYYEDADWRRDVAMQIRYRTFGPIHRSNTQEGLMVITKGEPSAWSIEQSEITPAQVTLRLTGPQQQVLDITLDRTTPNITVQTNS